MRKSFKSIAAVGMLFLSASLLSVSCKKDDDKPDEEDFDQSALLVQYGDHIITPAYSNFQQAMWDLSAAVDAFEANQVSNTLEQCQAAWKAAGLKWQSASLYDFGPAADIGLQGGTNTFPTDTSVINTNITAGGYNLSAAGNLAARGLPSLDYLLFGVGATNGEIIAAYSTGNEAAQRMQYLKDVVAAMQSDIDYVVNTWSVSGGNYRTTFVENTGNDLGSSLGLMLNAFNKSYESYIRSAKLGLPAGALTLSQTPLPTHVECYYEGNSNIDFLQAGLSACYSFFTGSGFGGNASVGLDDYLDHLSANANGLMLTTAVYNKYRDSYDATQAMSEPFSNYVVNNQTEALYAFGQFQQLTVLWKVDMMSSLGVLVTYQDNDGD